MAFDNNLERLKNIGFQENKKMSDHLRSEEFRQYVNKYIDKLAALCYWQGTFLLRNVCYVI